MAELTQTLLPEEPRERWIPPDQAARERIVSDLHSSLLVEAGAGSGKTTAMVGRMIELIRTGAAEVDQIAAVTFTRKAAAELRERFQEKLETRYRELAGRGATGGAAAELERLGRALQGLDRCFVGTIHSFCARLLRERPLEAQVPPGFQEISGPDEERLRAECWARFLERLTNRRSRLLARLGRLGLRPAQLAGVFRAVSDNPDVRWRAARAPRPDPAEVGRVRRRLEHLLDESHSLMPAEEPVPDWDGLQTKIRTLRFRRFVLGWGDDVAFLDALALAVGTKHDIVQKRWGDDRASREAAKELKARWDDFAAEGGAARRLLDGWLAHRYPTALRFARAAADYYARERLRTGHLNFGDLLLLTARLLRSDATARRELGERYRYLLVDEFQDTDPIQAEVVFLLADARGCAGDWRRAIPRPGALFVVGDPKQSIYRFRRADIGIYNGVKRRFAEFGAVLGLTANFRSTPPIEALVNRVFDAPGMLPPEETEHQARFAPLRVDPKPRPKQGLFWYRVEAEGRYRSGGSIARPDAEQLAAWIEARVRAGDRRARDFMILTDGKRELATYARALEQRGVPVQVSGARVGMEEELRELVVLLRALADPGDAVLTLAVLEGLFFGLSHDQLYAHAHAGGTFNAGHPKQPDGPVAEALAQLRELRGWVRGAPADVAVPRIVERLGLLPYAAGGELGATRAGALLYALDALRVAGLDGRTSLAEAIEVLDTALEAEADTPLMPGEADAVRVMNLHKSKGLEAPVVVLAYPREVKEHAPDRHVARAMDGTPLGHLLVADDTSISPAGGPVLALPADWPAHQEAERPYQQAETVRLLYVAATRAAEELVVARCEHTEECSFWRPLHAALDELGQELTLPRTPPGQRERLEERPEALRARVISLAEARARLRRPTYHAAPVTARVKGEALAATAERGGTGERAGRGPEWGTVVHRAMEAAGRGAVGAALRSACRDFLREAEGRPLDERGEPTELDELVELVEGLRRSTVWRRAARAERVLIEVPFSVALAPAELEALGLGAAGADGTAALQMVDGVIDLAFREPAGWVIADYKSDVFPTTAARLERTAIYQRQVDLYARCWERLTGGRVTERMLIFTSDSSEVAW